MNAKLEKYRAEYCKNQEKIAKLSDRNAKLKKQITELENLEIIGMVRSLHLTPEQLEELLTGGAVHTVQAEDTKAKEETVYEEAN